MMKLYLNTTSPYARFVRVLLIETGLIKHTELIPVDPWQNDPLLLAITPVNRIPVLQTQEGICLSESLAIAVYLQSLTDTLMPLDAVGLQLAGIGQGLMDTAFTTMISRKHYGQDSDNTELGQRRNTAIFRILDWLEQNIQLPGSRMPADSAQPDTGSLAVAVALDYLSFRLPEYQWLQHQPQLACWHHKVMQRASLQQTAFGAALS